MIYLKFISVWHTQGIRLYQCCSIICSSFFWGWRTCDKCLEQF